MGSDEIRPWHDTHMCRCGGPIVPTLGYPTSDGYNTCRCASCGKSHRLNGKALARCWWSAGAWEGRGLTLAEQRDATELARQRQEVVDNAVAAVQALEEAAQLRADLAREREQTRCISEAAAQLVGDACQEHSAMVRAMGFDEFVKRHPQGCEWCMERDLARERARLSETRAELAHWHLQCVRVTKDNDQLRARLERVTAALRERVSAHIRDCGCEDCAALADAEKEPGT